MSDPIFNSVKVQQNTHGGNREKQIPQNAHGVPDSREDAPRSAELGGAKQHECDQARRDELNFQILRGREVAGGALDAMEPRELADGLQGLAAVHLRVDRRRNRVRPEGDRAIFSGGGPRDEEKCRRRAGDSLYDESTLKGTTAPVFSQAMAILPP